MTRPVIIPFDVAEILTHLIDRWLDTDVLLEVPEALAIECFCDAVIAAGDTEPVKSLFPAPVIVDAAGEVRPMYRRNQ